PGLHFLGRVERAQPATPKRGLFGLFRRQRIIDWLCKSAGIPRTDALAILNRLGSYDDRLKRGELPLDFLAGNPRTLIGVEAAFARGAEVIVFMTVGLDPLGREAVFQLVSSGLHQCAAIHLGYPLIDGERICPKGRCIELGREALTEA